MKRKLLLLSIFIFCLSLGAQEHLRFKGIPIMGNVSEFALKLKNIGYTLLDSSDNMYFLTGSFAGFDNVNLEDCTKYGIQVCNASGVNANAVAEHVMAFILSWYKNINYLDSYLKSHLDERDFSEKTMGIIGLGNVGKKVAEYCNAFHMKVLGYSHKPFDIAGVQQKDLDGLYQESDIVSIHIPLNESTRHMIDSHVFEKMKSDAVLINTSRGAVINQEQLTLALMQGSIGGACLDVYEDEPLDMDNPLRDLKNVILTPHTAGLPDGVKYHKKRYDFFISNINKVMNGELPECRLNHI